MDPSLDMSIEALTPDVVKHAPPSDPWLARRMLGFGASEIPILLVGLGRRDMSTVTKTIAANARVSAWDPRPGKSALVPRIIAEKAGLRAPLAHGGGGDRERELVEAWARDPRCGIDPHTLCHASVVPREFQSPVRDAKCPALAASLDAWAQKRDPLGIGGEWIPIEAKCADILAMKCDGLAYATHGEPPWWWVTQVQAQMACSGAARAAIVYGPGWSYGRNGLPEWWWIDRDESAITEIREVATEAWNAVERLRNATEVP